MLDITVGRHLLEGESDLEAAERVSQEIGAKIVFEDLNYIGVRSCREEIAVRRALPRRKKILHILKTRLWNLRVRR